MVYVLNYKGKNYNLANYTQKTAFTFNMFFTAYRNVEDIKEKYSSACSACIIALGKDVLKGLFKDEENIDINEIFLLAEQIAAVYERPLRDYRYKALQEKVGKLTEKLSRPENKKQLTKQND